MGLTRITAQQISNIDYKQAVRVVTTTNITLAGGAPNTVDGVSLVTNDRVLVTGQSTGSQNGLYYVQTVGAGSTGTWVRSTDGDNTGELLAGLIIMVTEGTVYADTQWKLTTNDPITIGSTALTFVQNYSANSISAGTSNVSVNSNANVTISSNGTANVLTISSTGIVVSGTGSVTGNVIGGNLTTAGVVSATGNIIGSTDLYIGNGAATTAFTNPIIVAKDTGLTYVQTAMVNSSGNGSSDFAAYANNGDDTQAWVDIGFTGNTFNDANYTITKPNDGYVLVQGNASFGGNLVFSTGATGTTKDIVFSTGGFLSANEKMRLINSTGALSVVGNIQGGNILTAGVMSSTGNATHGNILTGGVISSTGNITGGNISATTHTGTTVSVSGTVTAASVVGGVITGTSASTSGNVTGGNLVTAGIATIANNLIITSPSPQLEGGQIILAWANISGITGQSNSTWNIDVDNNAAYRLFYQNAVGATSVMLTASPTSNVVSFPSTAGISAAGNISGQYFIGNGSLLTGITGSGGGGFVWTTANTAPSTPKPGDFWYQANTSVKFQYTNDGTANYWVDQSYPTSFSTLAVTGNATIGNLTVGTGNITGGNIVNAGGNGAGNIGSSGSYFNTVFAKATSAQYADLAENYTADDNYPIGTLLIIGGANEVTISGVNYHDPRVIGTISDKPAYTMNSSLSSEYVATVALTGRVPCRVLGPVARGDCIVASEIPGLGCTLDPDWWQPGCIVGKALSGYDGNDEGLIEIAIGRY